MAANRFVRWLVPIGFGLLPLTAGAAFAQGSQAQPQSQNQGSQAEPQSARPSERQLSQKTQEAMIRLHALNQSRAQYANAGAQYVTDPNVAQFLEQRAADYQQSDQRLMALAQSYGVNLDSSENQRKAEDIQQQWSDELQKLQQADRAEAANEVVDTFIKRNEGAIEDLRTLRGDVQEEQVRQLINQRISALEQESTQAQSLKQRIQQAQPQRNQEQQQRMEKQDQQEPMQKQPTEQY